MRHSEAASRIERLFEGRQYTRRDVFDALEINPHPAGGIWFTGYHSFGGAHFIFCNVGAAGRTGHRYANQWLSPDTLRWYGKTRSTAAQPQIRRMVAGSEPVYLFSRNHNQAPFSFAGEVRALKVEGEKPVEVLWQVVPPAARHATEEISEPEVYYEGATTRITVNAYERNTAARAKCIEHYGHICVVCAFDFHEVYGEGGIGFIHVHHLVRLSTIGERYHVDPITDLRPVCPNCHAMIHRREPPYEIDEVRAMLKTK